MNILKYIIDYHMYTSRTSYVYLAIKEIKKQNMRIKNKITTYSKIKKKKIFVTTEAHLKYFL